MKRTAVFVLSALMGMAPLAGAQKSRNWQEGTLMESEQQKVLESRTHTSNTDGTIKGTDDNKAKYSQNTTTQTTDNYDTFQVFTVDGGTKIYTASERLLFPWSKPANITVGEKFKFTVEKNTMYILDDDGKQHKASIKKVKTKEAGQSASH